MISHNLCKFTLCWEHCFTLQYLARVFTILPYIYLLPTCSKPRDKSLGSLQVFSKCVVCLGMNVIFYVSQNARVLACPNFSPKNILSNFSSVTFNLYSLLNFNLSPRQEKCLPLFYPE